MRAKGILVAAMVLAASWATGQASLSSAMDATGLKYKITKNGNAMTTYSLDGGRTQAVYVSKRTYQVGDLNLREIWSNAGTLAKDTEVDSFTKLLTDGSDENVGAWNIEDNDDGWLVYYSAKVPDLSTADLKSVMHYIATVADAKEQEITDGDDN